MKKVNECDACVINTMGVVTEVKPKNGTNFSLEELQKVVGGYIEVVGTVDPSRIMVLNGQGRLKRLSVNQKATALYPNLADIIVGNVLVCKRRMVK